jgi:hypothetical protein
MTVALYVRHALLTPVPKSPHRRKLKVGFPRYRDSFPAHSESSDSQKV